MLQIWEQLRCFLKFHFTTRTNRTRKLEFIVINICSSCHVTHTVYGSRWLTDTPRKLNKMKATTQQKGILERKKK